MLSPRNLKHCQDVTALYFCGPDHGTILTMRTPTSRQELLRLTATCLTVLSCLMPGASAFAGPTLLFEAKTGTVLYAEDQDSQWHPASLTKIMTAYLTFEALKQGKITLETKIPVTEAAYVQPPSKVGLPVGAEITIETALQALIVKSANDVAMMLAEALGGNEAAFVEKMNATAKRLGMSRTNFVNPNGLPAPEQMTTAHDLARLARAVISEYPEFAPYWSMTEMRIGNRRLHSHNGLLKTFEGADGLKTGFICDSGYNVVASATRDGHRLMAVVLGETSGHERTLRAASLLQHGFEQYGWKQMFNSQTVDNMPIAADAKPIAKMTERVNSWECGARRGVVKARQVRARVAAAKAAARKSAAAAQGQKAAAAAQPKAAATAKPAAAAPAATATKSQ